MADRRQTPDDGSAVAVAEVSTQSATEAYTKGVSALHAEEGRLSALAHRQEAGERLSRDEVIDRLVLQENIEQLRHEVEALRPGMIAEQQALDIADTVDAMNSWVPPHLAAFEQLVQAIAALYPAMEQVIDVHNSHTRVLNEMPAFRNLGMTIPSGQQIVRDMLSRLPDSSAWMTILLSPHSHSLTNGEAKVMADVYTTSKMQDIPHLTRQVQMQRSRR